MTVPALATERFDLHPFASGDAPASHRLWTAAPVREQLWDGSRVSLEEAQRAVCEAVTNAARTGLGIRVLQLKHDPAPAGFVGFRWTGIAAEPEPI